MTTEFHYPPEVLSLLVDTIPLLCRSKRDVLLFLEGAGVAQDDLRDVSSVVHADSGSITKFEIARRVLAKLNARGDSGLAPRREVIKRVVEFEEFSTCWPNDQLKAKGLIADLRKVVNVKDSFTRMKQEREEERQETIARTRKEREAAATKREALASVSTRLTALFGMDDRPHERGKLLEAVLNDLFRAYGVHVREDFRRKDPDTAAVIEQIDGVIELDGAVYLVEMKWLKSRVGPGEFFPHLSRLFLRANVHGLFIASEGFTEAVIKECTAALVQKVMVLCSLQELVLLLQRQDDLTAFLKKKMHAAVVGKDPYLEILR